MNIAVIHSGPRFGGIENQILLLAQTLKDVKVVYITDFPQSQLSMELRNNGIKVYAICGGILANLNRITHICKTESIEFIEAHTFDMGIKVRLLKVSLPKLKIIIRVHTYVACSWISNLKKKIYYFLDSVTAPLVAKFIINGKYLLEEYETCTKINKYKLVPVIDGIRGCPNPSERSLANIKDNGLKCLMIANVIPHKGHDILVDALDILKRKGLKIKCTVLGSTERDNTYYNSIKEKVKAKRVDECIEFIGFSRDIWTIINSHDVTILPSDSEGTPNCIMEAMSAKRLVVVSRTGGTPEMIDDGKDGFLHEPRSAQSLANALERIFRTSPEELGHVAENGYQKWKNHFSAKVMVEKFIQAYRHEGCNNI